MATLYTAYCTRAGTVNTDNRAEVRFSTVKPSGTNPTSDFNEVGKNLTGDDLGSNIQYDVSQIPRNASVTRARIVMTANANDSSVFESRIARYLDGTTPNRDSVTSVIHRHFKYRARARDTSSTQLALAGGTSNFDLVVATRTGCESAGQVLVLTSAGDGLLGSVSMWIRMNSSRTGTCKANVYSTTGSSGLYSRGELLATSNTRPLSDITVSSSESTSTELEFTLTSPLAVTSGQVLIVEVAFDPISPGFFFGGDTGFFNPQENALNFGPTMEAFGENVYGNGLEQTVGNGDRYDFSDGEKFVFPTFTSGSQLSIGDALYSPNVTLTNFTSWVQDGLDGRGDSNRLAFAILPTLFFEPDPPTDNQNRRWRSARHATPQTVDGQSFFGTVLQLEYTLPGAVKAFPPRARPAVAHGEVIARPAVSSPAVPRARAAVRTPEEARARPAINRGEARARPTVRRP